MNTSLPEALKTFVDERVKQQRYGTSSRYVCALIGRDEDRYTCEGCCSRVRRRRMTRPDPAIPGDGPPVVPREQAVRDIDAAIALDLNADGTAAAAASPRCAHERSLPGLHSWPFSRDPYVIFCVVQETHVDVWRVLHGRSDIPQGMQNPIEL